MSCLSPKPTGNHKTLKELKALTHTSGLAKSCILLSSPTRLSDGTGVASQFTPVPDDSQKMFTNKYLYNTIDDSESKHL